ncbi:nuclear transport factor 2 family protein [Alphaproteobacteria bacterium]|nr:nuclear transport factor 2 family protein [Alphaproteobacteria bacterium]
MLKNLTEQYISAFSNKDLDAISAMLTDDFILEDPIVKRLKGKAAALEAISNIFTGCSHIEFFAKNIYQDGDTTMIEFVLTLDTKRLDGVDILNWRDGKIQELRAYLDIPKA